MQSRLARKSAGLVMLILRFVPAHYSARPKMRKTSNRLVRRDFCEAWLPARVSQW